MIDIIAGNDINSLWGSFILNKLTNQEYTFTHSWGMDVAAIEESVEGNSSYGIILLGKSIEDNQVKGIDSLLADMASMPFNMVAHFANWGAQLEDIISIVDEDVNYISNLVYVIDSGKETIRFKDEVTRELAMDIAQGLESYNKYDGEDLGKTLMLLAELYQEDLLHKDYTSIEDMLSKEEGVLISLKRNMRNYVDRKIAEADVQITKSGTIAVSLFAEDYANEIGQLFIKALGRGGKKVIILIGKQTRGDDIYHIRTSEGVSADKVAKKLNRGHGKERAATVFLPKGNKPVYDTIIRTLNSASI